ncbi:CsgG/HfaB family protein [Persephonella sp.]
MIRLIALIFAVWLTGCAGIKTSVDTTEREFNETVRYEGPKARISVPVIFCKAKGCDQKLAGAVRDLLIDQLVKSNIFIILARGDDLQEVKEELLLSQSGIVDLKKAVPAGLLDGVDILIVGSITAVEPDKTRFFVPVFIPWREGGRQHLTGGLLEFKKSYIQMIVRLIDVRTGRVLKSITAEGEFTRWDVAFGEGAFKEGGVLGGVALHKKVPIEKASLDLVKKIADRIIKSIPEKYYRYR